MSQGNDRNPSLAEQQDAFRQINFFTIVHVALTKRSMWYLCLLLLAEFTSAFFQSFIPILLYINLSNQIPTITFITGDLTFVVASASAVTVFLLYSLMPGATGSGWFAFEQFIAEIASEIVEPESNRYGNRSRCMRMLLNASGKMAIFFGYLLKFLFTVGVQFVAMWAGVQTACYVVNLPISTVVYLSRMEATDRSRSIVVESIMFLLYVCIFNLFYRTSPQGHRAVHAMDSPIHNAMLLAVANYLSITVLFPISGSLMNATITWAVWMYTADNSNSTAAWTFIVGQVIGGVIAFAFILHFVHFQRFSERVYGDNDAMPANRQQVNDINDKVSGMFEFLRKQGNNNRAYTIQSSSTTTSRTS